ncbi:DUF5677 domain-containing protein [Sphingomonas qilianensis]|uniref:DUF5677 domain-containing protein n=1 Tax=Sphingomonas qilianensis TaxID=1736690 RepID=A0ABU9XUD7_9SPHN
MASKKRSSKHSGASLDQHHREGKTLIPPYARLPGKIELSSWRDDRLPEMVWATLICAQNKRDSYLSIFRELADSAHDNQDIKCDGMGHSRFATLTDVQFDKLFDPILSSKDRLFQLSPLLLLKNLPDRDHWLRHLPILEEEETAWQLLGKGIAENLWHQSQAATDIRWLRVICLIASGKMHFAETMREHLREVMEYPTYGDMRKVRPSIRAAEMAFVVPEDGPTSGWPIAFWQECLNSTKCHPAPFRKPKAIKIERMADEAFKLYDAVSNHFYDSLKTTDIDPRMDGVFGMCLYAITLHITLLSSGSHRRLQGRFFIRTIVEIYVTFAFLLKNDTETFWKRYRVHGNGQAKLAFLKLVDLSDSEVPSYVRPDELEQLANEDRWQEFLEIDLGNWAKSDLRKMSEEAGVKPVYDKFYGWPSGYVHGHWGAVRDTVFDLCLNPLHRYHRVPAPPRLDMGSVAPDSVKLINLILDQLSQAYPPFKARLRIKEPDTVTEAAPTSEK